MLMFNKKVIPSLFRLLIKRTELIYLHNKKHFENIGCHNLIIRYLFQCIRQFNVQINNLKNLSLCSLLVKRLRFDHFETLLPFRVCSNIFWCIKIVYIGTCVFGSGHLL